MDIEEQFQRLTPRYPELKGQVAVVTGGAKGIGRGIVLRLAREGMRVVIADKDEESLDLTMDFLRKLDTANYAFLGDISQVEVIKQLIEETIDKYAGVNLLINNAANLDCFRLLDEKEDILDLQLATNIRGPYLCSAQAAKFMSRAGGGTIINISSVGGLRAHWIGLPYDVTKGAVDTMTRAMAIDLAEYNIRVNAIAPGAIRTWRTSPEDDPAVQEMSARIPLRRFGLISEISSVVAFLASSEASYVTGQVIYVDGGITSQLAPPGQKL